jgi:hypothetical protein
MGPLTPQHGASSGCGWRNGLQIWTVTANTLNKQPRTTDKGWYFSLGVGLGANNLSPQKISKLYQWLEKNIKVHTKVQHTPRDRIIAQVVSRRLPTETARVRAQVGSRGIYGRQSDNGTRFLRVLRFPPKILIPPTAPHIIIIIIIIYHLDLE